MIALYIICAIILLIAFLLLAPITLKLEYDEEFNAKARYLFITYKFPNEEKDKKTKKKKKKDKKKKAKKKDKEQTKGSEKKQSFTERNISIIKKSFKFKGFDGAKKIISLAAYLVTKVSRLVKRHLIIKELHVVMAVGADDAAETAVNYGKTCAYIFPSLGLICNTMKVRKYYADIYPDFIRPKSRAYIYANIKIRPIFVIGTGISSLFHIIVSPLIKNKINSKINKAVQKNDEAEQK